MELNKLNSVIDYSLNRFCPVLVVGFLAFFKIGFYCWESYIIICAMLFSENFHYRVGYSIATCQERGYIAKE
jgi:hypothetical protein